MLVTFKALRTDEKVLLDTDTADMNNVTQATDKLSGGVANYVCDRPCVILGYALEHHGGRFILYDAQRRDGWYGLVGTLTRAERDDWYASNLQVPANRL